MQSINICFDSMKDDLTGRKLGLFGSNEFDDYFATEKIKIIRINYLLVHFNIDIIDETTVKELILSIQEALQLTHVLLFCVSGVTRMFHVSYHIVL